MRYLTITLALVLGFGTLAFGQNNNNEEVSAETYERMIRNAYEVDLRALAINTLNLTEEQIIDFTPVYMDYMEEQAELMEDRREMIEKYKEELAEDDSEEDKNEERAEFIEDYWQIDIDEMQVKNNYFDKLEDLIPYEKAMRFFDIEAAFQSRIARAQLVEAMPVMIELEPIKIAYETEKEDFDNWKTINVDGEVSLDHQYTHDGLKKLVNYAGSMTMMEGIEIDNFEQRKSDIISLAKDLTQNWTSTEHADKAKKAFEHTAELIADIKKEADVQLSNNQIKHLKEAASAINPSQLMTNQKDKVYAFFDHAQKAMNSLSRNIAMDSYEKYDIR